MTRELMVYILAFSFTFLVGVGIGAAITDTINRWGCENEKHNDSDA